MKKKVILYACIEKNIGDDLFVKVICNRYPQVEFYTTSLADYGSLSLIENLNFKKDITKWNRFSSIGETNFIYRIIGNILCKYYAKKIGNFDCAISIVGNAFKNYEYKGYNQSIWIRNRLKIWKNWYQISSNFGPYSDERWKKDFETIFSNMKDICFRDEYSYNLFKNIKNVRYAPDAVLTLGKQEKKNDNFVVISVIDCSMPERGKILNNSTKRYEKLMAECADYYVSKGNKVILLNSQSKQDNPAAVRILNQCKEKNNKKISIKSYSGNLEEIFSLYSQTKIVIGTRLHTIILAWLYNIPVVPIVYDIKVSNILDTYKFEQDNYKIQELDNISVEDIEKSLFNYKFLIEDKIINDANKQFEMLDKELKI